MCHFYNKIRKKLLIICPILNLQWCKYRGNKILEDSHVFLLNNNDIPMEDKIKIKCWQFWIVGFLSGQNCIIRDENLVTIYK